MYVSTVLLHLSTRDDVILTPVTATNGDENPKDSSQGGDKEVDEVTAMFDGLAKKKKPKKAKLEDEAGAADSGEFDPTALKKKKKKKTTKKKKKKKKQQGLMIPLSLSPRSEGRIRWAFQGWEQACGFVTQPPLWKRNIDDLINQLNQVCKVLPGTEDHGGRSRTIAFQGIRDPGSAAGMMEDSSHLHVPYLVLPYSTRAGSTGMNGIASW